MDSFYSPTQVPLHVSYVHSALPPLSFTITPEPPLQGEGVRRARECPHATAPVLKYKARGVKRTIPWKYSTNLSTEAKGQWARPLPSEGGRQ